MQQDVAAAVGCAQQVCKLEVHSLAAARRLTVAAGADGLRCVRLVLVLVLASWLGLLTAS
jgi:hypothetical protein